MLMATKRAMAKARRVAATATKRPMVMASRLPCNKEGNGVSGKSKCSIEDGQQATATRGMAMRVATEQRQQEQW